LNGKKNAYRILVWKPVGKWRIKWRNNIPVNLMEISLEYKWTELAHDLVQWGAFGNRSSEIGGSI
jgi:hypothetical protein